MIFVHSQSLFRNFGHWKLNAALIWVWWQLVVGISPPWGYILPCGCVSPGKAAIPTPWEAAPHIPKDLAPRPGENFLNLAAFHLEKFAFTITFLDMGVDPAVRINRNEGKARPGF